jgi:hypothetical protein
VKNPFGRRVSTLASRKMPNHPVSTALAKMSIASRPEAPGRVAESIPFDYFLGESPAPIGFGEVAAVLELPREPLRRFRHFSRQQLSSARRQAHDFMSFAASAAYLSSFSAEPSEDSSLSIQTHLSEKIHNSERACFHACNQVE